jgi:hypothetical protein
MLDTLRKPSFYLILLLALSVLVHIPTLHIPLYLSDAWRQTDQESVVYHFVYQDMNPFHPQFFYDGTKNLYVQLELQVIPFLTALLIQCFGWHTALLHVVPSAFFTLNVWLVYLVGTRFANRWVGVLSALVYVLIPYDLFYGQALMPEIFMLTSMLWALLAVDTWTKNPSWKNTVYAALVLALMLLAKLPSATAGLAILYLIVKRRGWRTLVSWKALFSCAVAFGIPYVYIKYEGAIAVEKFVEGDTAAYFTRHLASNLHLYKYTQALSFVTDHVLGEAIMLALVVGIIWLVAKVQSAAILPRIALFWMIGAFLFTAWVATNNSLQYYYMVWDLPASLLAGWALYQFFATPILVVRAIGVAVSAWFIWFSAKTAPLLYTPYQKPIYNLGVSLSNLPAEDRIVWVGTNPIIFDYSRHYGWRWYGQDDAAQFADWLRDKSAQGATVLVIQNPQAYPHIAAYLNRTCPSKVIEGFKVYRVL